MNRLLSGRASSVIVAACAVACGDATQRPQVFSSRDSAGVSVVTNALPPGDTVRYTEPDVTIGGVDAGEQYAFQELAAVAALGDGSIIVADAGASRVAMYDGRGEWQRELGGAGSGPGEFRRPRFLTVFRDTITVWDGRLRRFSSFTGAGQLVQIEAVNKEDSALPVQWLGNDWLDERESGQTGEAGPARAVVVRLRRSIILDTVRGEYDVPASRLLERSSGRAVVRMPPTFSSRPRWRACGGRLAWADPDRPRLDIHELGGQLVQIIELARVRHRVTAEDRGRFAQAAAARWGLDGRETEDLQQRDLFAEWAPVTGAVVCGIDDGLWVSHFDPSVPQFRDAVGSQWDIIDSIGRARTHVVFPPGFVLTFVTRDMLYGIARRELDVYVVEVYRAAHAP